MRTEYIIIIVAALVVTVILSILTIRFIRKKTKKNLQKGVNELEIKKNN